MRLSDQLYLQINSISKLFCDKGIVLLIRNKLLSNLYHLRFIVAVESAFSFVISMGVRTKLVTLSVLFVLQAHLMAFPLRWNHGKVQTEFDSVQVIQRRQEFIRQNGSFCDCADVVLSTSSQEANLPFYFISALHYQTSGCVTCGWYSLCTHGSFLESSS